MAKSYFESDHFIGGGPSSGLLHCVVKPQVQIGGPQPPLFAFQCDRAESGSGDSGNLSPATVRGSVERLLREQGVGSSNLPAPTKHFNHLPNR